MSGNHAGLTRRDVLRGATAATAGALLLQDIPAARAHIVTDVVPNPPVGVTLATNMFPRGTTMAQALREWQRATGCRPMATKVYFKYRHFPRVAYNEKIATCIATGMTAVLCYKPGYRPFRTADAKALEQSLHALKQAGLKNACVVLWTEQQSHHYNPRLSAAEFIAGSKFYASAARSAGWPVYWNSMGKQQAWASWCPGNAVDGYAVDDYANRGNWRDIWAPGGIARMADRDGKPFGWFEMGIMAGAAGSVRPSKATITSYLNDARLYLASRAPGTTGPVMWWGANSRNALIPAAAHPDNAWIARTLYPALYHALAA